MAAASAVNAVSVFVAAATYQPPWSLPVVMQQSILVNILLNSLTTILARAGMKTPAL
jgi:hypothetical protein